MNEAIHSIGSNPFEVFVLIANVLVAMLNGTIKTKLREVKADIKASHDAMTLSVSQLETRLAEKFLTKADYYAHQNKKD